MTVGRPLEILTFLHSFDPGGVERVALRLCHAWKRQGARVSVLMGRFEGATRTSAPPLDYLRCSSGFLSTARFETLWMIWCLWRRVRASPPDLIFCPGNSYTVVAVALRLLLGKSCPPIVAKVSNLLDRRDMIEPGRPFYRLWLRVQGRRIDHWVAIASALEEEIATHMQVSPQRVSVIEDPALWLDEAHTLRAARAAHAGSGDGRTLLSIGRLARQKRFDLLIDAFHRGARRGDRLVILGDGPLRAQLEDQVDRLGLVGRVLLPGHSDVPGSWLASADAFLLSSDYEGLPAVLVEALATGIPIVATRSSPGVADLLGRGRLGRLVEPGDVAAIADAIASDVVPPDAAAAHLRACAYTIERAAPAYLQLFEQIARPARKQVRLPPEHGVTGA